MPVRHHGTPPDLFGEGRGAVVEGAGRRTGYFKATLILAKHSEEYKAPHDGDARPGYKELMKTLRGSGEADDPARSATARSSWSPRPGAVRQRGGGGGRGARGRPALVGVGPARGARRVRAGHRALLLLVYAFLTFDFSVRYVATNTNLGTPFYYRITAVWGALEGSIMLWSWMLSLYTLIVVLRHRAQRARALSVGALTVMLGGGRVLPARDDRARARLRAPVARSPPTAAASTRCSKTRA